MTQPKEISQTQMQTLLAQLRAVAPQRSLTYGESLQVARLQAARLRTWANATEPDINLVWLLNQKEVPVNRVAAHVLHEESGMTTNAVSSRLEMFVNVTEPEVRQRFSLLHEFKHVIDFPDADRLHAKLGVGNKEVQAKQIELLCNEFAGHVLMPQALVTRAWAKLHSLPLVASLFNVSNEAMRTRLEKLGLLGIQKPRPRSYFRTASGQFRAGVAATAEPRLQVVWCTADTTSDEVTA